MFFYTSQSTDPTYNLAMEEHLLREHDGDIFFLWRNAASIIIGRNQNAYSEINVDYVQQHDIRVVRRITGGGAVFHDLGNVNFSFIAKATQDDELSFARFTAPVVDYLRSLGINAALTGRNDIEIDGKKISGNAQTRVEDRFLHHGTLLFEVGMTDLTGALQVHPLKIKSKGIASVRARVSNISEHLPEPMTVEAFMQGLVDYVRRTNESFTVCEFTQEDDEAAKKLQAEKYSQWSWNFGENPRYSLTKAAKFPAGLIEVQMNIDQEVIQDVRITGDFFAFGDVCELEQALCGVIHRPESIRLAIRDIPLKKYIGGITAEQLIETMF
ncbi:MAG: lipoate--protein ligase [Clostridia bacterium]|nr:lipoate--protein ligase [Clostridia bacterium]